MIQFNLLPDVKKEYVKAKRTKRLIFSAATLASAAAVGATVLMFTFVHVAQKKHINDLTNDITSVTNDITSTEDLNNILTVQNQLSLLPSLHEAKPETSRLFDYLAFVSPQSVQFSTVDLDSEQSTVSVSGNADSIATINKLADNLKTVRYALVGAEEEALPYSNVISELSANNDEASFTIDMTYDPTIFSNTQEVIMRLGSESTAAEGSQ